MSHSRVCGNELLLDNMQPPPHYSLLSLPTDQALKERVSGDAADLD